MSTAAIEARRLTLIRLEQAAGTAFGYEDGTATASASRLVTPTTVALATFATAAVATLTYLV